MKHLRKWLPYLILLAAFAIRGWQLTAVPPGLTHDEADHGHDAAYILKGVRPIYFTVGYGREPLFDYWNAGFIAALGANPFTLRFSAMVISLLTLAATYRVGKVSLGRVSGTAAMALMAASFWPLVTSRQILRSDLLPVEMALAAICFLKILATKEAGRRWLWALGLALALAAGFYTYIPARFLWVMFPLALAAAGVYVGRELVWRGGPPLLAAIALAAGLAAPLAVYLYQNPDAEQRIGMLSEPISALQNGNAGPLLHNAEAFWLALYTPGQGDTFLAYNIPGQPVYDVVTAGLALLGFVVLLRWWLVLGRRPGAGAMGVVSTLLLAWLVIGLAPAFVTGPEALTTRIIGAQPVLYLLPAFGLSQLLANLPRVSLTAKEARKAKEPPPLTSLSQAVAYLALPAALVILAATTAFNYFFTWGQAPEVRAAYKSTLVAMLTDLHTPSLISSQNPNAPHDPYIGELLTTTETRWADARYAVILRPQANAPLQLVVPASTPLHPFFVPFFQQRVKVTLSISDLDPYYQVYEPLPLNPNVVASGPVLNNALQLRTAQWLATRYKPGDTAELVTGWQVLDSGQLGAVHAPTFRPNLVLFTHVFKADESVFLQQDRLDAPAWDWQTGDLVLQIHQFTIPNDAPNGQYRAEVGFYDPVTGDRLPVSGSAATTLDVPPLIIDGP